MDVEATIAQAEATLRELTREWERFFAGERPTPPQPQRVALERRLRMLSEAVDRPGDEFRVEALQNRFMTYANLWDRQLRAREEGRVPASPVVPGAPRPAAEPNAEPPTPVQGTDREGLYARYAEAKRSIGQSPGVDRETFLAKLEVQRAQLEARLGGRVSFDVVVEGGKVKLAARRAAPSGRQG